MMVQIARLWQCARLFLLQSYNNISNYTLGDIVLCKKRKNVREDGKTQSIDIFI